MIPTETSDMTSDEPPYDMNGSGLPVMGKASITLAMFRNAWNTSATVSAPATVAAKGLAKGAYKVKVRLTAPAGKNFEAASPKTVTLTVRVK